MTIIMLCLEVFMKRIISIFLLLAMLIPLSACGGDEDKKNVADTAEKTADTTVSDIYYEPDDLPENLNFDGAVVNILVVRNGKEEFSVEDLNSEVVNDSIYNRERFVEERLGVEINVVAGNTGDELEKQMRIISRYSLNRFSNLPGVFFRDISLTFTR